MAIDLFPTIAELTGSPLPSAEIDGEDVWPVLTGQTHKSPHEAYYFYYHRNELHAIRYEDWKLYFPHRYRTLSGRPGGTGGLPVDYDYVELQEPLLYNLKTDPGETRDLYAEKPALVEKMNALADSMRAELGDALREVEGRDNRPPAAVSWEDLN